MGMLYELILHLASHQLSPFLPICALQCHLLGAPL